jgi:hypothetical protein
VARLLDRKLVRRDPSPEDGRRAEVRLTPSGAALLARAPETLQAHMVAALAELPPRRLAALAAELNALAERMGRAHPPSSSRTSDPRRAANAKAKILRPQRRHAQALRSRLIWAPK